MDTYAHTIDVQLHEADDGLTIVRKERKAKRTPTRLGYIALDKEKDGNQDFDMSEIGRHK